MNNKITIKNIGDDKYTLQILDKSEVELSLIELKELHHNIQIILDQNSKCKCLPEWLNHKIELNTSPYGNDFEYDECKKCKTKHNLKFIR